MWKVCYAPAFGSGRGISGSILCLVKNIVLALVLALLLVSRVILLILGKKSQELDCRIRQINFEMKHCMEGNDDPYIILNSTLETWLASHPAVAAAIVWQTDTRQAHPYSQWNPLERAALVTSYENIRETGDAGLPDIPPVTVALTGNGKVFATDLTPGDAWKYFVAYVAQSLAVEINRAVPWSVRSFEPEKLFLLFNSISLFEYLTGLQKYGIMRDHNILFRHGSATPGDPARTFGFLKGAGLIGADARATIENVVQWCRQNMYHYCGSDTPQNFNEHWQFEGYPPIKRVIDGTNNPACDPVIPFQHYTAGCWGTTGFLRTVLHTANIPVRLERRCDHALPHFVAEGLFMSHADDPYNARAKWQPPIPVGDLLLPIQLLGNWFGPDPSLSGGPGCTNIGRGVLDAVKANLPYHLLRLHCLDIAAGKSHAQSDVFQVFSGTYTVAELEAENLWGRIDAKIAQLGGCANIPAG